MSDTAATADRCLVTVFKAATATGLSTETIRRAAVRGDLGAIWFRNRRLVDLEEVRTFAMTQSVRRSGVASAGAAETAP